MNRIALTVAGLVGVAYVGAGVLTYSACLGRYDDKFPGWDRVNAPLVRRTCTMLAIMPVTGLPVLILGTDEWRWKLGELSR